MRFNAFFIFAAAALVAACDQENPSESRAPAAGDAAPAGTARSCASLSSLTLPNTTITLAESVAAGKFAPPSPPPFPVPIDYSQLPDFCRVAATVKPTPASDIKFEIWLPARNWNGKLMGTGNGGAAGSIFHFALAEPLARGYAVANTDTGHEGFPGDMSFASGQSEKLADFNYRSVHEMTVASKAIVTAHYGDPARHTYWNGCSTGGRQGLKEVQRFPEDYDGAIVGAPANNLPGLIAFSILVQRVMNDPNGPLPVPKLQLLKDAAIAACDVQDGVSDRVIGEPSTCRFDPATLQCPTGDDANCLTPAEVAGARRVYGGVVNPRTGEQVFPGSKPAAEPAWAAFGSPQFSIGTSHFRHAVVNDPTWDPYTFDFDADIARIAEADAAAGTAMEPDISAFVGRGGKLLMYHGWTDGLISPGNTINYYESVVANIGAGAAKDSVRLYMLPGVDHCQGGEGAFIVDYIGALENWVEKDQAPERMVASRPPGAGSFTRPACSYPSAPRYNGTGAVEEAASWVCSVP